MNKKPVRTGPRVRMTKPANGLRKFDPTYLLLKPIDERKYIYTCQYCCLKFTQNSHFFRHMQSNHELQQNEATFECNDCQIIFNKKSMLDHHCQTEHQSKSKSKCGACAITFKSRYCLRRHLKLKQLMQENSCVKCHKKFTSKELLAKHTNNKHTYKNTTHKCDLCLLQFRARSSLQIHLNRIHKKL